MHPLFASISDWDIDSNLFAQAQAEFGKLASVWDCWFDSAYSEDYGIADYGFLSWVGGRVTSISSVQGDYCQMQKSTNKGCSRWPEKSRKWKSLFSVHVLLCRRVFFSFLPSNLYFPLGFSDLLIPSNFKFTNPEFYGDEFVSSSII